MGYSGHLNKEISKNDRKATKQNYIFTESKSFTEALWENITTIYNIRHKETTLEEKNQKLIRKSNNNPVFCLRECMNINCKLHRNPSVNKDLYDKNVIYFSEKRDEFEKEVTNKAKELFFEQKAITVTFFGPQNLFAEWRLIEKLLHANINVKRVNLIDTAYENSMLFLNKLFKFDLFNGELTLNTIPEKFTDLDNIEKGIFSDNAQFDILLTLFTWFQFTNWFKKTDISFHFYPNVQKYLSTETKSHLIVGIDFQEAPTGKKNREEQNKQALNDFNELAKNSLHKSGIKCALYCDDSNNKPVLEITDQWMLDDRYREQFFGTGLSHQGSLCFLQ